MRIASQAPCRVDLAGGTLDIWPLYLYHANAVTVNFAVDRYTRCVLETRADRRILVSSKVLGIAESFESLEALNAATRYKLPLPAQVVRFFAPRTGFELWTDSEAPPGAGISGSSALIIAIVSALNRLTGAGYKLEKLREISQNIEAQIIRVPPEGAFAFGGTDVVAAAVAEEGAVAELLEGGAFKDVDAFGGLAGG